MVARTLELLLQEAGYETLLLEEPASDRAQELLEGASLLLLLPAMDAELMEAFLEAKESTPTVAGIPVLALSLPFEESERKRWTYELWPSHFGGLKRTITTA